MAQQLSEQKKAAIVCEFWFRQRMNTTAIANITHIICAFFGSDKEFVYESDYDGNGIVHWVGTNYGKEKEWRNPAQRELIKVDSSGWDFGSLEDMVGNEARESFSENKEGAWASIEFVDTVMVKPTKYTLLHALEDDGYCLRSWVFEGKCDDNERWTLIREHTKDESLNKSGQSHSWLLPMLSNTSTDSECG